MAGMLIGICGFAGAGKDTVADALVNAHGFNRKSFAYRVKKVCADVFSWVPREHFFGTQAQKAADLADYGMPGWTGRRILEEVGTGCFRGIYEPVWLRNLQTEIGALPGLYVVPDVRFRNEFDWVRERGGVVWRVTKVGQPHPGPDAHESAVAFLDFPCDANLVATKGDVAGLHAQALALYEAGGRDPAGLL